MGEALAQDDKERAAALVKGIGLTEAVTSVLAYVVLLLLSVWGAQTFTDDASLAYLFRFYGLFLLVNLVYETSVGVLQAADHFNKVALVNFYQSIALTVLITAAFFLRWNVAGVLTAYLIGKAVAGFMVTGFALQDLNDNWDAAGYAPLKLVPIETHLNCANTAQQDRQPVRPR
jgi:O-antigen/teichoic acid export membrane protein